MNPLDILIAVIVGYCMVRGVFRGMINELSSIIGVIGGFYAAYSYYGTLAAHLSRWISNQAFLHILSFLLIFCIVLVSISLIGIMIKYLLKIVFLGWMDRLLGAGFGFLKGVLIAAVVLFTLTLFLPKGEPIIATSQLSPHVTRVTEQMSRMVSQEMKQEFGKKTGALQRVWQKRN